jgi:hypothetical protein
MTAGTIAYRQGSAPHMRVLVCVLLGAVLLSNPFLNLFRSPGDISVRHPVSKRATIASSELQHFSPVSGSASPELSTAEAVIEKVSTRVEWPVQSTSSDQVLRNAPPELSASLWFRPPPLS